MKKRSEATQTLRAAAVERRSHKQTNKQTNKQTHTQTDRGDYNTLRRLARSVISGIIRSLSPEDVDSPVPCGPQENVLTSE